VFYAFKHSQIAKAILSSKQEEYSAANSKEGGGGSLFIPDFRSVSRLSELHFIFESHHPAHSPITHNSSFIINKECNPFSSICISKEIADPI
jgi:hypothetical protein